MGKRIKYKRVWVLALVFLVGISSLGAIRGNADWIYDDSWHYEDEIRAGDYSAVHFKVTVTGYKYEIDFRVTSGNDVTFFICDEQNFWAFKAGERITAYNILEKVGSGQVDFEITASRIDIEWYVVYSNKYSTFTSKHVSSDLTRYKWMTPPSMDISAFFSREGYSNEGEDTRLTINVKNDGDQALENVAIQVDLPRGISASQTSASLGTINGHSSQSRDFTIYCNDPGSYTVTVRISANNAPMKSQTVYLTVREKTTTIQQVTTSQKPIVITQQETITERATEQGGFVAGFSWFPVLLVMAIWVGLRRRRT